MTNYGKRTGVITLACMSLALLAGCKKDAATGTTAAPIVDANNGPDPASVNDAPVAAGTNYAAPAYASAPAPSAATRARVLGQRASAPQDASYGEEYPGYDPSYDTAVDAGEDAIYAEQAPPPLPVYQQPELTQPGYEWTPGYWDYASTGYYWVPGAWVPPPYQGALWTPGYWGHSGNRYRFHRGFWGLHIGFYGGIPYGFGYTGQGYDGGYWNNNSFYYNRSVNRINSENVRNVYERNVTVFHPGNHSSYNGPGGIERQPQPFELAALREQRTPALAVQINDRRMAQQNRQQFFSVNRGSPQVAVRPAQFAQAYHPAERAGFGTQNRGQVQQAQQQNQQQQRVQQEQQNRQQDQQRPQAVQQRQQQNNARNDAQQQQRVQQQNERAQQLQQHNQQNVQRAQQAQQRAQQQQQQRTQENQQRAQQNEQRAQQNQQRQQQTGQREQQHVEQQHAPQPQSQRAEAKARPEGQPHEDHGGGHPRR